MRSLQVENRLSIANYFCISMMLYPLAVGSMPCNRSRRRLYAYVLFRAVAQRRVGGINAFVKLSARNLTQKEPFPSTNRPPCRKKRFSRRFVLVPKGGSCTCRQNEFLFKPTAINTRFWAICSKM